MSKKITDTTIAHQVENAVRRLDSISILPCVATRFLSQLSQFQLSPPSLDELIESEPALSAKIFSLAHQKNLSFDGQPSIRQALDKITLRTVRDAFFSIKVYPASEHDRSRVLLRKQLLLHSIAVACCAKYIAEIIDRPIEPQLAYSAALLHNIGNFALDEVMPRSFASIVEEAKSKAASICAVQQRHLGLDYTIIGKRLAQKWHLPEQITLAIWLHHSNTGMISKTMPEARIAQIVQLAVSIARQCGIGQSCSFDSPVPPESIAASLNIKAEQLEQIRSILPAELDQKSKVLGLDLPDPQASYLDIVHTAAAQLAQENTQLSMENRRLQTDSSHFDFITDFLLSIGSANEAIDIAENFAARWQKHYQTGPVCLYLLTPNDSQSLEAVVVENRSQTVILKPPAQTPPIPQQLSDGFAILDAQGHTDWLFEQLDIDFDLSRTKLMPLLSGGKAIGAIIFQLNYPSQTKQIQENLRAVTSIAGAVLDMAFNNAGQQDFAEQFARVLAETGYAQPRIEPGYSLSAMAEMAAGAAHELNNPLSVISGRAQMLHQAETDAEKKKILELIRQNTNELSQIIDGLMSFAEPQPPRPTGTNIRQILDEAAQLAAQKANDKNLDVRIDIAQNCKNVFVDSAQIASAIANIFSNSLESYADRNGPVEVTAATHESGNSVKLQITDYGCGMDSNTLKKATQPFFSAKPAGRKRGMGLAYADRLIQLNNGTLDITSQPGSGTAVTISVPCK